MTQPEMRAEKGKPTRKLNVLMFFLLVFTMVGVAFLVYLKSQNIDIKNVNVKELVSDGFRDKLVNTEKKEFVEIDYDEKENCAFNTYKDTLIQCTKDHIKAFNREGKELWSLTLSMNKPRIKRSGGDLLVYDVEGKELYVLSGKDIKWDKKLDNAIISADISESGHVSVAQETKGYKGMLTVYNLQGNEFFTRTVAKNFLLGSKVSPSGKTVLLNTIDTSGIKAGTGIEFTDMFGKSLAAKTLREEELYPNLWFLKDELVIAVNESGIICVDGAGNEKWKQEFTNRKVYSAGIIPGKYVIAAVGRENNQGVLGGAETDVIILNSEGKQTEAYEIQDRVLNIETYSDLAAVNTGREIYFINTRGKLVGKYTSKADVVEVHFFNRQQAAVVTKTNVVIAEIQQ